jgi:carbon storage regulator
MLVIRCKVGESVLMPGLDTRVTVVAVKGKKVRLGVSAPAAVTVHREEVWRDIGREESDSVRAEIDGKGSAIRG